MSPRELFETLIAVLFGTILSQQVLRPSLPPAPRSAHTALPPGIDPSPVLLLLDPPPLASCFPTSISIRHNQTSLRHVLPPAFVYDEINISPIDLNIVIYSAVALVLYLVALAITTYYTSRQVQPRSHAPVGGVAQLYQRLTGRPLSPTRWERVSFEPGSWDIHSPDLLFGLDAPPAPETPPQASDTPSESSAEDSPKYAGYFDAERVDAFAAFLLTLGYTDLRIWAFDITPDNQPVTSSAVTVDFRFTARSATQELMTRSILRFVLPGDVPEGRKDFMLWDLGRGWVRAFEVGSFEAETIPVGGDEGENLACLAVLPFFFVDDETAAGAVAHDLACQWAVAITSPATSTWSASLDPLFAGLLFNQSAPGPAKLFRHRVGQRRATATAFAFDYSSCHQQALVPANHRATWPSDAFIEQQPRGRPTMRKLLAASVVPGGRETRPRSFLDMAEDPMLVADCDAAADLDGSWCSEDMSDSQRSVPPEDDSDFVVVARGELAAHASEGPQEARAEARAVVEATEASPGLGDPLEAADVAPRRPASTAVPEAPASDALRDVALAGPHPPAAIARDGEVGPSERAGSPPDPPRGGLAFGHAERARGVAPAGRPLRESVVDASLAQLPGPDPLLSPDASIGALVDAALNSVIELPAPELLSESIVDVRRDLPALEPAILKAPGQYLRVYAGNRLLDIITSVEDLDVEEPQSVLIGPAKPPSGA